MIDKLEAAGYIRSNVPNIAEMQLQKLLYFAHGWSLAWTGRGLFHGDFEAWKGGPVDGQVWRANRSNDLPAVPFIDDSAQAIIDATIAHYGHMTGGQMSDLTHMENTPWSEVRGDLHPSTGSTRHIPDSKIRDHFVQLSLAGEQPSRVRDAELAQAGDVQSATRAQAERWREALDALATR